MRPALESQVSCFYILNKILAFEDVDTVIYAIDLNDIKALADVVVYVFLVDVAMHRQFQPGVSRCSKRVAEF